MTERRPNITWHVDRGAGSNLRRIRAGDTTIAYGKTEADARCIADTGNAAAMLLVTLEIARDILANHAPDFQAREAIVRLIDSTVRYARKR
jgi:hypothetical protein